MKDRRNDYDDNFVKAITGRVELSMKYLHLELSTDQWFSMTLKQRESYVRKIRGLTILEVLQGDNSPIQSLGVRTATPNCKQLVYPSLGKKYKAPLTR